MSHTHSLMLRTLNLSTTLLWLLPCAILLCFAFPSYPSCLLVAGLGEKTTLLGKDAKELALIRQYLALTDNEIGPISAAWVYPVLGYGEFNEHMTKKAKADALRVLGVLDAYLLNNTFLVGECVTLADIYLSVSLVAFYKTGISCLPPVLTF